MTRLDPLKIRYLVLHTAAHRGDAGVDEIRRWHVNERKWLDIGYHFVIRKDGTLEEGRPIGYVGAHVAGINSKSIGICFSGHGDYEPFTEAQEDTLMRQAVALHHSYGIMPQRMIGHREVNDLIDQGEVSAQYRTTKTCPGLKVDMDRLRLMFLKALHPLPPKISVPIPRADR